MLVRTALLAAAAVGVLAAAKPAKAHYYRYGYGPYYGPHYGYGPRYVYRPYYPRYAYRPLVVVPPPPVYYRPPPPVVYAPYGYYRY